MNFDLDKPVCIQDTVHICTKLKTRMTNNKINLIMGNFKVSVDHLKTLVQETSKDQHLLCLSNSNSKYKLIH